MGVCRTHYMRNLLTKVPKTAQAMVATLVRTIFAQPDGPAARAQLRSVVDQLEPIAPDVAARLASMEGDLLAYSTFPPSHWSKIWSNNPIERSSDAPTSSESSPTPSPSSDSSAPYSSRSTTR